MCHRHRTDTAQRGGTLTEVLLIRWVIRAGVRVTAPIPPTATRRRRIFSLHRTVWPPRGPLAHRALDCTRGAGDLLPYDVGIDVALAMPAQLAPRDGGLRPGVTWRPSSTEAWTAGPRTIDVRRRRTGSAAPMLLGRPHIYLAMTPKHDLSDGDLRAERVEVVTVDATHRAAPTRPGSCA